MPSGEPQSGEDVTPNPGSLIESLRDFGYTLPTAIADLVDNSVTAGARRVQIDIAGPSAGVPHIAVVDDGCGMPLGTLVNAMRLGTVGPRAHRENDDLGRFGLGLKTASLSQGTSITVISRTASTASPIARRLDLEHIVRTNSWQLIKEITPVAQRYAEALQATVSGTAVIVEHLDRATFFQVRADEIHEHLGAALKAVAGHLQMVFHRHMEQGLQIRLGGAALRPWDPFMRGRSTALPEECLALNGQAIKVSPFVLPHHSKLTDEEHEAMAGPHGWNAHQGFYIYRADRLIVPGTWLNLGLKKEEHFKLARIAVDLPNSLDAEWHLNVMKAHVAAPAYLRDDLRRIATGTRRDASEVYRHRGERVAPGRAARVHPVWTREDTPGGVRFRIDRRHPAVQSLLHGGCAHDRLLAHVLSVVEQTVPVAAMLQQPAKALDGSVLPDCDSVIDQYAELAAAAMTFLVRTGKPPAEAKRIVLSCDPFAQYRDALVARLFPDGGDA